jgi:hypothetical protein
MTLFFIFYFTTFSRSSTSFSEPFTSVSVSHGGPPTARPLPIQVVRGGPTLKEKIRKRARQEEKEEKIYITSLSIYTY